MLDRLWIGKKGLSDKVENDYRKRKQRESLGHKDGFECKNECEGAPHYKLKEIFYQKCIKKLGKAGSTSRFWHFYRNWDFYMHVDINRHKY